MTRQGIKFISASVLGNVLEWYDFALYGYFATVIARLFFPSSSEFVSLLITFGVFATGFFARPLGGMIFGHIGDKHGRKTALLISIILILFPTTLIGLLPTWNSIGIAAPISLVLLRFLQGMAVSGELTGSGVYLVESASSLRKGFYGSLIMCSTYLGLLIGALVSVLVSWMFTPEQFAAFAWRIPFLISFPIGLWVVYLRLRCEDTPMFQQLSEKKAVVERPVVNLFKNYSRTIVILTALCSILSVVTYMIIGYFPTYFIVTLKMTVNESMALCSAGLLTLTLVVPVIGLLVNKSGPENTFAFGSAGLLVFAWPIFNLFVGGEFYSVLWGVIFLSLLMAPISASVIFTISRLFPTEVRCSGVSISYNLAMCIFGGTTPVVSLWACEHFGVETAPAIYIILTAVLSLCAFVMIKRERRVPASITHMNMC